MKRLSYVIIFFFLSFQACTKDNATTNGTFNGGGGGGTGQGGSLARFTIARNHLYVVDNHQLYTYSLTNSAQPQLKSNVNIGIDIETIYSYEDKLFVGSQNAMYIYSIADPAQPTRLGSASHVRACDPVVANDSLAYVTVRAGSSCGGEVNALLIYDVRNVLNPTLRNTVPLTSPWGLGLRGNRLYICDGTAGLKVYDISSPVYPQLLTKLTTETYYDVIPTNDLLIAMVKGGTALYSYSGSDSLTLRSKVAN